MKQHRTAKILFHFNSTYAFIFPAIFSYLYERELIFPCYTFILPFRVSILHIDNAHFNYRRITLSLKCRSCYMYIYTYTHLYSVYRKYDMCIENRKINIFRYNIKIIIINMLFSIKINYIIMIIFYTYNKIH